MAARSDLEAVSNGRSAMTKRTYVHVQRKLVPSLPER